MYVNSNNAVTECDFDSAALYSGSFVAPGCSNNWTVAPSSPPQCELPYIPKTLTFPYASACGTGQRAQWNKLAWDAVVPTGTSIQFEVRTRARLADGGLGTWTPWVTAGQSPTDPAVCSLGGPAPTCPKDLFAALGPTDAYNEELELRITMQPNAPTANLTPTLNSYSVNYSCVDVE